MAQHKKNRSNLQETDIKKQSIQVFSKTFFLILILTPVEIDFAPIYWFVVNKNIEIANEK